ncbi:MAG: IMPACT family protein [Bacteroidales bacterium]
MSAYKTIKNSAVSEYKEMKSKFISFAYPINSSEDVKPLINKLRSEYFDARHHCYAWRIDEQNINDNDPQIILCRTNDDREPNNTAGIQILAAIDSNELKNVLIVVVRYFGGIKLGAANLSKAYRTAAQNVINKSEIIIQVPKIEIIFSFDFAVMEQVNKFLKENNFTKETYSYVGTNKIKISFDKDKQGEICSQLHAIYGINIIE